jgi:hypothetical protein
VLTVPSCYSDHRSRWCASIDLDGGKALRRIVPPSKDGFLRTLSFLTLLRLLLMPLLQVLAVALVLVVAAAAVPHLPCAKSEEVVESTAHHKRRIKKRVLSVFKSWKL